MDDQLCAHNHQPPVAVIARFAVSGVASAKTASPNMGIVGIPLTFQLDQPSSINQTQYWTSTLISPLSHSRGALGDSAQGFFHHSLATTLVLY